MNYQINWLPDAEITFNQNIEYLENEWNAAVLRQFFARVASVLRSIEDNPYLYPIEFPLKEVRKCVINKRIVLYYRIASENRVDLLLFWNTYQHPDAMKY